VKDNVKTSGKVAALALLLVAFTVALAGEAQAKPKWLGVKLTNWTQEYTNSEKTYDLEGDWTFEIRITNNSDDRIVTQLSEMKGEATFTQLWYSTPYRDSGAKRDCKNVTKVTFGSNKPQKVKLTPGESKTFRYRVHAQVHPKWAYEVQATFNKWTFDCSAKSKKEE
jgi:hypothetical protein